jgi:hypothetical protein
MDRLHPDSIDCGDMPAIPKLRPYPIHRLYGDQFKELLAPPIAPIIIKPAGLMSRILCVKFERSQVDKWIAEWFDLLGMK